MLQGDLDRYDSSGNSDVELAEGLPQRNGLE
jgi:hypothetical protein